MNISAKITGLKYQIKNSIILPEIIFNELDINSSPPSFILTDKQYNYGISKWVSPKRTRSYPFERVYNTLNVPKRITIIPIIKDEGLKGDRDFIQWDTISLMSLLDVFIIYAYYDNAIKHTTRENKISKQVYDNEYIKNKIIEKSNFHSSAIHWNFDQINEKITALINIVENRYSKLSSELEIKFHSSKGLEIFKNQFDKQVNNFKTTSRIKAQQAQKRECLTTQPKEFLSSSTKAAITINNYLGGEYYFTTDEIVIHKNFLYLIEGKHTGNSKLPSISDIKDGLLKMVLYCNLVEVKINEKQYLPRPILKMTSTKIKEEVSSKESSSKLKSFLLINNFSEMQSLLIKKLFNEAKTNNFEIRIEGV